MLHRVYGIRYSSLIEVGDILSSLYCEDKKWLYFIEAVTSVGPMSPKRVIEIQKMTEDVIAGKIYITAFLDMATYKKFVNDIAWDTEIWISEMPDHMIHMNGDRFMGSR